MSPTTTTELRALAETDVREPLPAATVVAVLQSSPFIPVEGTFNTRDLGLVPSATAATSASADGTGLRPGLAFRSGMLTSLTDAGKATLAQQLHVRKVFDLRSQREHASTPDPAIDGVGCVWRPTTEQDAIVNLAAFVEGDGERGYVEMYMDVLDHYRESFRAVLEHVRDSPGEAFLFHCTAGRDRTGVLAGLLLTLAGAPKDVIALDYLLSRVGTEPAREQLIAFAQHGSRAASIDTLGFANLCSLRESCWDAFTAEVDRVHGGFEGYVVKVLGFSEGDLDRIKENLAAREQS